MTLIRLSIAAVLFTLALSSCDSDFDPTKPSGSTPYVLCVLNAKDSAQYVRIQRSYICQENAFNFSMNSDSLYYIPERLNVYLTRFDTLDGSIMPGRIKFYPTDEVLKDTGAFATTGHYLFKTMEPIHAQFEYELSIEFPEEDKRITSRILPLGAWNFYHAFGDEQRKTRYQWYTPERIEYFMDLTPTSHPQITRFLYTEYSETDTSNRYIEYFHNYDTFTGLDENFDEFDFLGDDFLLRFIQREIKEVPKVKRMAVGVDFMIQIADSNLLLYRTVQDPDSKFLYTSDFNNIRPEDEGTGLFASRYKLTLFGKALKPDELDSLSLGKYTRHLNFADSKGDWHDGK